jgi:GT2 family glycosyltransferase
VAVIILNWRHAEDTLACLASLNDSTYPRLKILVVDNGSQDGSVERIRSVCPDISILALTENLGYAGGNNAGLALALQGEAEWFYLLNDDITLDADCISVLMEAVQAGERVGIAGPTVYHASEMNLIQSAGGGLDGRWRTHHLQQNQLDTGGETTPRPVEWINGCAILVSRQVIEQIGLLDERFFMYYEEADWCLRAGEAGWKIWHVPKARVWHKGVQPDYRPGPYITYYMARNRLKFLSKHSAPLSAWLAAWMDTARAVGGWTVHPDRDQAIEHRRAMIRGVVDYLRGRSGWVNPADFFAS